MKIKALLLFVYILFLFNVVLKAQSKIIYGLVKDGHSDEPLPFSSVLFKGTTNGKSADAAGIFKFEFNKWPSDTLEITSVGYKTYYYVIPRNIDNIYITAALESGVASAEVIVKAKAKHSRGWYIWRKVMARKDRNNIFKKENFTYHVYNRLEVDINNVNPDKIGRSRLLKPFSQILLNSIDSISEDKPILPVFFSETISDYYFQKNPHKTREIIEGNKISGVKNESITKYLGALNQNVVIYDNFIPVFDKQFISPFNDNGDVYYNYRLADTQYVAGRRLLHLIFIPKHEGQSTFTGDCWVHDSTFAIQKVILHLNKDANINFVDKLSVVQEFKLINDSTWFLSKDKFYVNLNPIGNSKTGFIARKTANYENPLVNNIAVSSELAKNLLTEEVQVSPDVKNKDNEYWDKARLEKLSKNEEAIYKMVDTLQQLPAYKRDYNTLYFLSTGYKNIGNYQIGPWASWVSGNLVEGLRLRFDVGTNKYFSKKIWLHGYLAYGFNDQRFKQKAEALWLVKHKPWETFSASYTNDLTFSQNYNSGLSSDNVFALALRKNGIPIKLINLTEIRLQYFRDTKIGLSTTITVANKKYDPLLNLPDKTLFGASNSFTSTELTVKFRFGYLEKFLENTFFRYSLGSDYPIPEIEFTQGVKGVLNSHYSYQKIKANISDIIAVAPLGKLYYNVFAGKVFGTLPYMLLEFHPGNELYIYNPFAFNLMNKYEYLSDQFAGFSLENNVGNGLFRFIPFTRKLKFRQFWNLKGVVGSLSDANKQFNFSANYPFTSLDNKLYLEAGTGVDNIFKVLRLDFVWRLLPTPLPVLKSSRFGVFGSIKIQL